MQTSIGKYQCIPVAFTSPFPLTGRTLRFTPKVFDTASGDIDCDGAGEYNMAYPATPGVYPFANEASLEVVSATEFTLSYCFITGKESITGISAGLKYFKYTACVITAEGVQEFHYEDECPVNSWCQQGADFTAELLVDGQVVSGFVEGEDATVRFTTSGSTVISNTTGLGVIESNIIQYVEASGSNITTFENIPNDLITGAQGFQSTVSAEFEAEMTLTGLVANANYRAYAVFKEGEIYHSCFFDFTGTTEVPTIDDSCEITIEGQTFSGCCIKNIATGSQINVCNIVEPSSYTGVSWNPSVSAGISSSPSGTFGGNLISSSSNSIACAEISIDWTGCRYLLFKWQNEGFDIIRPVQICANTIIANSLPIDSIKDQDGNDLDSIICSEGITEITVCYSGTDGHSFKASIEPIASTIFQDTSFSEGKACVIVDATSIDLGQEYCITAESSSPNGDGESPGECLGAPYHYAENEIQGGVIRTLSVDLSEYTSEIIGATTNSGGIINITSSLVVWGHSQLTGEQPPAAPIEIVVSLSNGTTANVSFDLSNNPDCLTLSSGGGFCIGTLDVCFEEDENPVICEDIASIQWECEDGIVMAMAGSESLSMVSSDVIEYNEDCGNTYSPWPGSLEAEMICLRRIISFADDCPDIIINEVIDCPAPPDDVICENTAEIEEIVTDIDVTLNLTSDYSQIPTEVFQVSIDGGISFTNIVSGQIINIEDVDNLIYSYEATFDNCEPVVIEGLIEFGDVVPCEYDGFSLACAEVSEGVFEITKEGDESLIVLNELLYTTDGSDPQSGTIYTTNVTADMIASVWLIKKEGCPEKRLFAYCCKTACEPEINIMVEPPAVTVNVDACCDDVPCDPATETFESGEGAELSICE